MHMRENFKVWMSVLPFHTWTPSLAGYRVLVWNSFCLGILKTLVNIFFGLQSYYGSLMPFLFSVFYMWPFWGGGLWGVSLKGFRTFFIPSLLVFQDHVHCYVSCVSALYSSCWVLEDFSRRREALPFGGCICIVSLTPCSSNPIFSILSRWKKSVLQISNADLIL